MHFRYPQQFVYFPFSSLLVINALEVKIFRLNYLSPEMLALQAITDSSPQAFSTVHCNRQRNNVIICFFFRGDVKIHTSSSRPFSKSVLIWLPMSPSGHLRSSRKSPLSLINVRYPSITSTNCRKQKSSYFEFKWC